jgi:hypothetical protein
MTLQELFGVELPMIKAPMVGVLLVRRDSDNSVSLPTDLPPSESD